ncbi:MAG: META domain-containing protein, partial [Anaerolineales bacterium]|nr:META domain-containing protein [Anaerolineales bacterium]
MKKLFSYIPLAGMILLFLAACAGASTGASDPLDGTSWELWAFRKTKPIPGTTFTVTFEDGQVRGSAGCNSYGGSYQIDGDRIFVGEMVS